MVKLLWPIENPYITQHFGENKNLLGYGPEGHKGTDLRAAENTRLRSPQTGFAYSLSQPSGFGTYFRLHVDEHMVVYLAHCNKAWGGEYGVGEICALSGNTGNSTGAHVHVEVRIDGVSVDPELYMVNTVEELEEPVANIGVQCQGQNYEDWVVDHANALGAVKLLDPDYGEYTKFSAPILGRLVFANNTDREYIKRGASGAEDWFNNEFWPRASRCPEIEIWEGPNEPIIWNDVDANILCSFYVRLAQLYHAKNKKIAGPNFSTQHPEVVLWKWLGPMLSVLDYLTRHDYAKDISFPETDTENLYRIVDDVIEIRKNGFRVPPILITETGIDFGGDPNNDGWRARGISAQDYTTRLWQFAIRVRAKVPEIEAIYPFIWLSTGWPSFDIKQEESQMLVDKRPESEMTLEQQLADAIQNHIIPLNPNAALEKRAQQDGWVPASDEVRDVAGYVVQGFRRPGEEGVQKVYGCVDGDWGNVFSFYIDNETGQVKE